ncbi:hypothetical protein C7H09_05050 [Marinobacter fuscus]|uniref:Porin n=1 Tax=Marinobacter fuscus TaxID=2109942 RepID=A0A2T1KP54_9GAMM|nr:DcaP family trimeric outer membrane transporter [Marinobacter fuscus]PSF11926.1 hypothetical protein C7H09_05050 [Marinobacter fuscus]
MHFNQKKLTASVTAAMAMGVASHASAISFEAGDAKVDLYGYARLNAVYDIDESISRATGTQSGDFSRINTGADEDNEATGYFDADAVQSRIGVRTTLPTGVKVNIEGDFRGGSTGGTVRLRHAYGQYENWLLGQTWSNYNSFVGGTSVLEFDGVAGDPGLRFRKAQVRYTNGPLSLSVEDSTTRIEGATPKNGLPAFTARFEDKSDMVAFSTAAVVQQVGYDDGTDDDTAFGYAVFGSAKLTLTDTLSIQGSVNYSDGGNAYLWRSGTNYYGEDAYVVNGNIETISGMSGNIGASLKAAGGTFNLVAGMTEMDWDDAEADGISVSEKHERNTNAFFNYQWSPVKSVNLGVQYGYFKVKKVNGEDGDASRVLFAAQYNF